MGSEMCIRDRQLTASLETELSETVQSEGMTAKAQLQTRRLGNVRTLVTDLTRIRLNAFTQHAVLVNLMKGGGAEAAAALQRLSVIDWERHDPTERAYYQSLGHSVDKYKHDVAWKELVNGSNGGATSTLPPAPSPDTSLSEFTETPSEPEIQPPPSAPVTDLNETWDDPEFDEEDRIRAMDEFPDRATGADPHPPEEISVAETIGGELMRIRILQDYQTQLSPKMVRRLHWSKAM